MTGFDVKSLATIYLDKPLKAHTLMQTIARANRVCDGKSNGLIVDYIGVVKALRQALADYTTGKGGGKSDKDPAPDKEKLLERIKNTISSIKAYMQEYGFDLSAMLNAADFAKLALVKAGANAMCTTLEVRKRFEIQARELFRMFKYVEKNELESEAYHYKNAISEIYDQMQEKKRHADNSALMAEINRIVSSYLIVKETISADEDDSKKFDISKIDFDRLRKEFEKAPNKNLLMKDLQELVEARLAQMLKENPLRINYYERYQEIVEEYNKDNEKDAIAIIFEQLMKLVNDLDAEERRYVREGFNNDEELAIYDLLFKETLTKEEIKKVKALSQTLLGKIKERIRELDHWTDKEETCAMIDTMIRDMLYTELPMSYDDNTLNSYRQKIYEYVYTAYPAA